MKSASAQSQKPETGNQRARVGWWHPLGCILILLFCFAASGCRQDERSADLTIINGAEPQSLDPAIITGQPEFRIVQGLFEGLMQLDPKTARPVPGLASRFEISPDGLTYTFHLRTNLVWSTGGPITANDVVYSWIRALNPATASEYAGQLYYVKNGEAFNTGKIKDPSLVGVHALDKYTVQVRLNHPTPFFLEICAMPITYVVPRQTIEKYGDHWIMARPLPSSGPYELVSWRLNDKVRLKKNPRYWDAAHTESDIIDILPTSLPSAALNLYMDGQADIVWDKGLIPSELIDLLLKRPDFHRFNYLGTYFIRLNVTRKPFNDPRVRRALALAIDKELIVKRITRAGERPAATLVPGGTANYSSPRGLGYNPAVARRLLAQAGYPGGKGFPTFDYLFNSSELNEDIAVELQQMWRENLGVHAELRQQEWKVYLSEVAQLQYDTARASWIADYDDPNTFLDMFTSNNGNNQTGWTNATYDALIHAANAQVDLHKREKLFQQAESILVREQLPIIPLYFYVGVNYFDTNKIHGIYENVLDDHPLQYIRKVGRGTDSRNRRSEIGNRK